jgi:hypothetical protein
MTYTFCPLQRQGGGGGELYLGGTGERPPASSSPMGRTWSGWSGRWAEAERRTGEGGGWAGVDIETGKGVGRRSGVIEGDGRRR